MSAALLATMLMATQLPMRAQTTDSTDSAQTTKHTKKRAKEHRETAEETQLRELREALKAEQEQIDALKSQVSAKSGDAAAAQQTAADAQTQAAAAAASAAQAQAAATAAASKADAVSSSVSSLQTTTTDLANTTNTVAASQKKLQGEIQSPASLHYKGVNITPGGFAAFEGVYRQHSVNSDINTPLNNIPFPSANEGHTSELNFSGRQSRLSVLFTGDAGTYKLSGYYEADFLGTGTSSNNNQSNSYVLRQRQIWGKGENAHGFAITGGQTWSLIAEDAKGTDTRTEIQPLTIDPQYVVGYSWTRQPGIRVQQRWGDYKTGAFTIAVSAEQAQITNFTASGSIPTDFYFGGIGQNGGLYNAAGNIGAGNTAGTGGITTYANNVAPDVLVKGAYDLPKLHVEVGGIARFLRNEFFPVLTVGNAAGSTAATPVYTYGTTLQSNTATGGGVFGSIRVKPINFFEVAVQGAGGPGLGRYGSSQLADATLKPNETLEPIRNYHGLFSLVVHPAKNWDFFGYYGGEYDQRTEYTVATPNGNNLIGYGPRNLNDGGCYNLPAAGGNSSGTAGSLSAVSCASPTRYIQEAVGGFIWRAINSPSYGRLQYSVTYSYIQRNLWSGVGSATTPTGPRATEPMVHVQMRYYIP